MRVGVRCFEIGGNPHAPRWPATVSERAGALSAVGLACGCEGLLVLGARGVVGSGWWLGPVLCLLVNVLGVCLALGFLGECPVCACGSGDFETWRGPAIIF